MHAAVIAGLAFVVFVQDGRTGVDSRHLYWQQVLHTYLHSTASAGNCHKNQKVLPMTLCHIAAGISSLPRAV